MYEQYWHLTQKPFENGACEKFYYPSESHQGALLKLRYAVENRRGGALLTGGAGLGKTLIADVLKETLGEQFTPFAHCVFPQMSTRELLCYLADELDGSTNDSNGCDVPTSVRRIQTFLAKNSAEGQHAVLAVDEAHLIDNSESFEAIRLLLNFESDGNPGMTLMLIGQPSILPVLERMPQLEERLAVKCLLRPLTAKETVDYVRHRMAAAGATRDIFEPDALETLHTITHGVPRQIARLCDLALLIGFAEERQTVNAESLESVSRELIEVVPE